MMATICVINDNTVLSTLLAEILSDRGDDRVLCCTSTDVFDLLKRDTVDLIILDVMTKNPESGWDVLTFLQMHPRLSSLPVIVCSAANDELCAKKEWLRAHRIAIVEKPFELEELDGPVDAALGRSMTRGHEDPDYCSLG
jgi:DNA-binding response OmpR family regulator